MRAALLLMGERRDELGSDFDPTRHRHIDWPPLSGPGGMLV
jgi:hypothetical protein